ncbi:MAG: DJ-1/PfpI family protein, partial [Pseudoclavibacter sp.]
PGGGGPPPRGGPPPGAATRAAGAPAGYAGGGVPGGAETGAAIRGLERAQDIVNAFAKDLKPIAAICHAPWLLADAGLAQGATMTSYPELEDDLKAAGATWVDRDVVVDDHGGVTVITSRTPKDLDAFTKAIETALVG